MVYVFLADGFEEIEAVAPIDIMRRAGIDVVTVGVGKKRITGSHGMTLEADTELSDIRLDSSVEAAVLPGGGRGTENLKNSEGVRNAVRIIHENGGIAAAICAAPTVLFDMGLLDGKHATVYPTMSGNLAGAYVKQKTVLDGRILTAEAAGSSIDFGLLLVKLLKGDSSAADVRARIYY